VARLGLVDRVRFQQVDVALGHLGQRRVVGVHRTTIASAIRNAHAPLVKRVTAMARRSAGLERDFRIKAMPSFPYFRRPRQQRGQM
jgi:hypothetical protein